MNRMTARSGKSIVCSGFADAGIGGVLVTERAFPDETIYVVYVASELLDAAMAAASTVDARLSDASIDGFVVIKEAENAIEKNQPRLRSLNDDRVEKLVDLMTTRSRTSTSNPSLEYIKDAVGNLNRSLAARHHLIFGRRGAGKTALLLEAKSAIKHDGHVACWVNLQTYRSQPTHSTFCWIMSYLIETLQSSIGLDRKFSRLREELDDLSSSIQDILDGKVGAVQANALIPRVRRGISNFTEKTGCRVYIFLDDLHYLQIDDQPQLLDDLHAVVRDCNCWIKVATIKHLSRWFNGSPPVGLQIGHDAEAIDLDLGLQNPKKALHFLRNMLATYAATTNISPLKSLVSDAAIDRLVLASGGVPRDFLVLCSRSVGKARERNRARSIGKQDVTKAAGELAQDKIAELEDDASSSEGYARAMLNCLGEVRLFCLQEEKWSAFRVDSRQREQYGEEYHLLQGLMDARLAHLVNSSVSDPHEAGQKSEIYMLDLSQFSGERFKKQLHVLDLDGGTLLVNKTGTTSDPIRGTTPRGIVSLLRRAPLFDLARFTKHRLANLS